MNIGERIKTLRKKARLTQIDVAEKMETSQSNYGMLESGKTELTYSKIVKLAEIFGVSVGELLGIEAVGKAEEAEEVEVLKKENEKLQKEKDILMKIVENQAIALGQFAKESIVTPEPETKDKIDSALKDVIKYNAIEYPKITHLDNMKSPVLPKND